MILHRISSVSPCLCIIQTNTDPEIEKRFLSLETFIEQCSKCTQLSAVPCVFNLEGEKSCLVPILESLATIQTRKHILGVMEIHMKN